MVKKAIKQIDYSKPLKNRQYEAFCQFYHASKNATQSAKDAKYSKKTANVKGSQLLTIISIKERLDYLDKQLADKCGVTAEMLAEEYKKLAFSNLQDYIDANGDILDIASLPRDKAAAIQSLDGKAVKLHSKEKALDSLGRHIGFFERDNVQQNIIRQEPLTEAQLKARLAAISQAGTGLDNSSIG